VHMIFNNTVQFMADLGGLVTPGGNEVLPPPTANGVPAAALPPAPQAAPPAGTGIDWWVMLLWIGVLVAVFFWMTRSQRKKEKQVQEMQSGIRTGDEVVTSGGLFGKVVDVGDDCFVVEFGTNRGIRIPVQKSDIMGVKSPKLTPPPKEAASE